MDNLNYSYKDLITSNYTISTDNVRVYNTDVYFITKEEHEFLEKCKKLGMIGSYYRTYNEGKSDYSKHIIQPWSIWQDYNLNPWDADIIKRVLRTKEGESKELDYKKIIHICNERIRQLNELRNKN